MIDHFPSFPLEAFIASEQQPEQLAPNPTMLSTLTTANLIFGRDITNGNQFLVYGRDVLHDIVNSGMARPVKGLVIEIDQGEESDELEKLIALIRHIKGRDDYLAGETIQGEEDQTE